MRERAKIEFDAYSGKMPKAGKVTPRRTVARTQVGVRPTETNLHRVTVWMLIPAASRQIFIV